MQATSSRRRRSEARQTRRRTTSAGLGEHATAISCGLIFHRLPAGLVRDFVQPAFIRGPREAVVVGASLCRAPRINA